MHIAVFTTFAASRKEPLAESVDRIHAAFLARGFGEPSVHFTMSDAPGSPETSLVAEIAGIKRVSSIERVLKRWPQWQDAWRVNGRQRSVAAMRIVEADPGAKKLPVPPPDVAAVLAACGKARKTVQVPMAIAPAPAQPGGAEPHAAASAAAEKGEAIRSVVSAYRARMAEFLETLPHDLSEQDPSATLPPAAVSSGAKKPDLVRAFAPLGYDCRGETGTFTLRRRTSKNLTVKLTVDVGTWSDKVLVFMQVQGLLDGQGFKATLNLPVSRRAARGLVHGAELAGQFPIGTPDRWRRIVDNLAALAASLDRSFVPEIEAVSGPSPEWYQPDTG
jgi:hypothetical protein